MTQRPETVLADAGYWHKKQMENVVSDGIQVLVPPDAGLREGTRPGWDKGAYAFMRRVLSSDAGHELYKHRKATVEPVFAQNKFNRGIRRFQRRGRAAARSNGGSCRHPQPPEAPQPLDRPGDRLRVGRRMASAVAYPSESHDEGCPPAGTLPDSHRQLRNRPGRRLPRRRERPDPRPLFRRGVE